jgi:hypothetical protein
MKPAKALFLAFVLCGCAERDACRWYYQEDIEHLRACLDHPECKLSGDEFAYLQQMVKACE